ncbi:MAG: hypothetical protein R6V10_02205 [bacterium]
MDKIKLFLLLVFLAAACGAGTLAGWKVKERFCHKKIAERDLVIERMKKENSLAAFRRLRSGLEMFTKAVKKEPSQKSSWRAKSSGKELDDAPPDCEKCLAKVKREVVVKDEERGWWVYRDPDVLDEEPGEMELTPKLFADTVPDAPVDTGPLLRKNESPAPAEKVWAGKPMTSVKAGTGLHEYQLEIEYSPLRLETRKADLSMVLGSRLTMDHHTSALKGDLTAGIELRW